MQADSLQAAQARLTASLRARAHMTLHRGTDLIDKPLSSGSDKQQERSVLLPL